MIFCAVIGYHIPTCNVPPGARIIKDFISEVEEQALLDCVDWQAADAHPTTGITYTSYVRSSL